MRSPGFLCASHTAPHCGFGLLCLNPCKHLLWLPEPWEEQNEKKRATPQASSGGSPTRASSLEIHLCPLSAQRTVTHGDNNVERQIFMVYKHLYSLDLQGWLRRRMTLSSRCAMTKEALADGIHPFTAVEANSDHFRLLLSEIKLPTHPKEFSWRSIYSFICKCIAQLARCGRKSSEAIITQDNTAWHAMGVLKVSDYPWWYWGFRSWSNNTGNKATDLQKEGRQTGWNPQI